MNRYTRARLAKWRVHRKLRLLKEKIASDSSKRVRSTPVPEFDRILSDYRDQAVFVHVGLSDVKRAFGGDPYDFLRTKLTENFSSVMAPGFTPSFRDSGVFHSEFSRPEYGTFSKLFLEDAEYRTDDAIHSILVEGDYRFDECGHHESFGETGCWAQFDHDDILYLNVGTNEFVTTQLHYIEVRCDLPYVRVPEHRGVVYTDRTEFKHVTQRNYGYSVRATPNWAKIRDFLIRRSVIEDRSIDGLKIYAFRAREMRKVLESKLEEDPYFIIT